MIKAIFYYILVPIVSISSLFAKSNNPIKGIEVNATITKVVLANNSKERLIVASSYEGDILLVDQKKGVLWRKELSGGVMNHEILAQDLDNDGKDEILAVNANGTLYCLNIEGNLLWKFKQNNSPLISLCVIHQSGGAKPYVVCGGNDRNIYYVSAKGVLLNTISSTSYLTNVKPNKIWTDDGTLPKNTHTVNFLRALPQKDGSDVLLLDGIVSNTDTKRELFQFKPLELKPFKSKLIRWGPIGDSRVRKLNGTDKNMILFGFSGIKPNYHFSFYDPEKQQNKSYGLNVIKPKIDFGYRVTQTEPVIVDGSPVYFVLLGERVYLVPNTLEVKKAELVKGIFSYNDMCYNSEENKIILASVQSGGSQIHILDLNNNQWKKQFKSYIPKGNIASILQNSDALAKQLATFNKPTWEKAPENLVMMSPPRDKFLSPQGVAKKSKYKNLTFMGYQFMRESHEWDRSKIQSQTLRNQRDGRKKYVLSEAEVVNKLSKGYNKNGLVTWGGHGVDPFMYGPETIKKVIDRGNGKMSVWIWPELTILHKKTFGEALDKLFYPLADYAGQRNSKLYLRCKHVFWQSYIYKKEWSKFLSGELADAFVPALEETLDQTQDLSLAGRLGLWTSGVCNSWGSRAVRDNASYMRNRQFSHQNLPNHFLRNSIYHISYGAEFINNFGIKSKYSNYMTLLWDLAGKGAIYIPKANEILSFSPVHLSMLEPDKVYLREGNSMNATIRYDKDFHPKNPFVFNRLSAEWSGAEVPVWDFSKYASGVVDRRSNFIPPYPNGMVLITPPQKGVFVQKEAVRGKLENHLHPFYKGKLKEFYTDGRFYYSADGKAKYNADDYYKVIAGEIKKASQQLPVLVTGDVAWVVAQTSPKHLRLTLIDKGYLNPKNNVAKIKFNNIKVKHVTNLLTKKVVKLNTSTTCEINVPAGMFKFIDIELEDSFMK